MVKVNFSALKNFFGDDVEVVDDSTPSKETPVLTKDEKVETPAKETTEVTKFTQEQVDKMIADAKAAPKTFTQEEADALIKAATEEATPVSKMGVPPTNNPALNGSPADGQSWQSRLESGKLTGAEVLEGIKNGNVETVLSSYKGA